MQDGDNRVQFGEFCVAMDRTMRGSMDERLNYVFQLFGAPDPTTGGPWVCSVRWQYSLH